MFNKIQKIMWIKRLLQFGVWLDAFYFAQIWDYVDFPEKHPFRLSWLLYDIPDGLENVLPSNYSFV